MTLTITIDDKYQSVFTRRVTTDETAEVIASRIVAAQFDAYLSIDDADMRAALAADSELVERGKRAQEVSPEKRAQALAAFDAVLDS